MNNKAQALRTGIIGILALLVGVGGTLVLNPGELSDAYVCSSTGHVGIWDRLSSTRGRAYPYPNNNSGYRDCKNGTWMPCNDYARERGFTCSEILVPTCSNVVRLNIPSTQRYSVGNLKGWAFEAEGKLAIFSINTTDYLVDDGITIYKGDCD